MDAISSPADEGQLLAEQLPVNQRIECGTYRVTEAEIIEFASQWDPQHFHIDPASAAEGFFGGIIASGVHSMAIFQRLAVAGIFARYAVIGGKEMRHLRFRAPLRPGDTVGVFLTITSVLFDRPGRAVVISAGELINQTGQLVMELEMESLVRAGR